MRKTCFTMLLIGFYLFGGPLYGAITISQPDSTIQQYNDRHIPHAGNFTNLVLYGAVYMTIEYSNAGNWGNYWGGSHSYGGTTSGNWAHTTADGGMIQLPHPNGAL